MSKYCGFTNIGNTCYMNSVLQLILNSKQLNDFVAENNKSYPLYFKYLKTSTPELNEEIIHTKMIYQLDNIIKMMDKTRKITPTEFKKCINYNIPDFDNYKHQDAHEFLLKLLDIINEECGVESNHNLKKIPDSVIEYEELEKKYLIKKDDRILRKMLFLKHNNKKDFILNDGLKFIAQVCKKKHNPFSYSFWTFHSFIINCSDCNHETISYENTSILSVDIEKTLDECLDNFYSSNKLDDYYICTNCKGHNNHKKNIIIKTPETLFIHLKRFKYTGYHYIKNNTNIVIPDVINLRKYTIKQNKDISYKLIGYLNHYGGLNGGHYTAECIKNDKWMLFDDSNVCESNNDRSNSYICMYQII